LLAVFRRLKIVSESAQSRRLLLTGIPYRGGTVSISRFLLFFLLWTGVVFQTKAAFTSFHVFGDSLSCTASNLDGGAPYYYGKTYSNGPIWVEVLAEQLGLAFNPSNNPNAFFGNTSSNLLAETSAYAPPADASNALVVIWVNNADLYYPALDPSPTLAKFTNAINLALTNQFDAITNLYAKGIRTLVMPNVVDIATIPQFNTYASQTNLFHQVSTNYNAQFYVMLDSVKAQFPQLNIIVPDYFTLLNNLLSNPSEYGVTNTLGNGLSIDALDAENYGYPAANINGYGTNYIFWDPTDPTALVHTIMAGVAQQAITQNTESESAGEPLLPTWGVAGLVAGLLILGVVFLTWRTAPAA
jgi:cholinesterase